MFFTTKITYLLYVLLLAKTMGLETEPRCPVEKPEGVTCVAPATPKTYVEKNIVTDFGADPTGKKNSHLAFACAAYFFNMNEGYGKLIIPYGKYKIGIQQFSAPDEKKCVWIGYVGWLGKDLFHLVQCQNLEIEGQLSSKNQQPVIVFEDSLKLGGFRDDGKPSSYQYQPDGVRYLYPPDCKKSAEVNTYASNPGTFFWFEECDNIKIRNVAMDGNSETYKLGSYYGVGPAPYELWDYGIMIWNSKNISMDQLTISKMGTDGILVKNFAPDADTSKNDSVTIASCNISGCGRNNLSWVGGYGLLVKNSSFTGAGTGQVKMDPGAGIDIEPESHEARTSRCHYLTENGKKFVVKDFCVNGTFINCTMKDNRVHGLLNASANGNTVNCKFINSAIENRKAWGLTILNRNDIIFENCTIIGRKVVNGKVDVNLEGDPKFKSTRFQ